MGSSHSATPRAVLPPPTVPPPSRAAVARFIQRATAIPPDAFHTVGVSGGGGGDDSTFGGLFAASPSPPPPPPPCAPQPPPSKPAAAFVTPSMPPLPPPMPVFTGVGAPPPLVPRAVVDSTPPRRDAAVASLRAEAARAAVAEWPKFVAKNGLAAYEAPNRGGNDHDRAVQTAIHEALRAAFEERLYTELAEQPYFESLYVTTPPPARGAATAVVDSAHPLGDPVRCADATADAKALCGAFEQARGVKLSSDGAVVTALHRLLLASTCTAVVGSGMFGTALRVCAAKTPRGACTACTVVKVVGQSPYAPHKAKSVDLVYNEIAKYAAVQERLYKPRLTPHLVPFLGYAVETVTRDGAAAPSSALGALFMGEVTPWLAWPLPDGSDPLEIKAVPTLAGMVEATLGDEELRERLVAARVDWTAWWQAVFAQVVWTALAFRTGFGRGKHNDMHAGNVMFTSWPTDARRVLYVIRYGSRVLAAPVPTAGVPMVQVIDYGLVQGDVLGNADDASLDCETFDVFRFAVDAVINTFDGLPTALLRDAAPEVRSLVTAGVATAADMVLGDDTGDASKVKDLRTFVTATNNVKITFSARKAGVRAFLARRGWPSLLDMLFRYLRFRDVDAATLAASSVYEIALPVSAAATAAIAAIPRTAPVGLGAAR